MSEPDALAADLEAYLRRATHRNDKRLLLEPEVTALAARLDQALVDDDGDVANRLLLGWVLWFRHEARKSQDISADLEAAARLLTPCYLELDDEHVPKPLLPFLAAFAAPAGEALLTKALLSTDPEVLESATRLWRRIVAHTSRFFPSRPAYLINLASCLRSRFERFHTEDDLSTAVDLCREALDLASPDHRDRARYLNALGNALQSRFGLSGQEADLDAAVRVMQEAVATLALHDPARAGILSNLGSALRLRFNLRRVLTDIDAAVSACQKAADLTPPDSPHRSEIFANLAAALSTRFEHSRASPDADRVARSAELAASDALADDPRLIWMLRSHAEARANRYAHTVVQTDLDAAVIALEEVVALTPIDGPDLAEHLYNLGSLLQTRYERAGWADDLAAAIRNYESAVAATPAQNPDRPARLSSLGSALYLQFEQSHARADADAAVQVCQQAIDTAADDHPERADFLNNLSLILRARFERSRDPADLDTAVQASRGALKALPADAKDRPAVLNNLGHALLSRSRADEPEALDEAIAVWREALTFRLSDDDRAMCLTGLGTALLARSERPQAELPQAEDDLDAAVLACQDAIDTLPADHPGLPRYQANLGSALRARYRHSGSPTDSTAAAAILTAVMRSGMANPWLRVHAGRAASQLAAANSDLHQAAALLGEAVLLLPQVAPWGLNRADQQQLISEFAGLTSEAAALTLSDPALPADQRPGQALRLLEAGRTVLLAQTLPNRTELTELRARHPELADDFVRLRGLLNQPESHRPGPSGARPPDHTSELNRRRGLGRRQLAAEFTSLLARIRGLAGFSAFALPPSIAQLQAEAAQGPIVTFNVNDQRSDALILTTSGVTTVRLPEVTPQALVLQVTTFYQALAVASGPNERHFARAAAQEQVHRTLIWLWDAVAEPVLDALALTRTPPDGTNWPRVWWAPSDLLGLLPIHAAGHHDPAGVSAVNRTVMDRVISSYTPTAGALRRARAQTTASRPHDRAVIVAMGTTPDAPDLPNAAREAFLVREQLPNAALLASANLAPNLATPAQTPTKRSVIEHLSQCAVAHFACHGRNDLDPSLSTLLLQDHEHDPLTVASLANLDLQHARLAYLSACSTAVTRDTRFIDEALHLTSAFQLAGFPHVIGTLWQINDHFSTDVAHAFYTALGTRAGLDIDHASRALHTTIRHFRDRLLRTPSLWAAYLHTGV